ncbi:MAG TPA: GNAT family N-acetyltransferase [Ramlibacter sp.]|jgi:ribosomal-protein-alanine N-acetyltransferase
MTPILIEHPRFLLRDFTESDRAAFLEYQSDPRYLALYDFDASDTQRAGELFDLFRGWSQAAPRRNFQIGVFDRHRGELCGCAGLRRSTDEVAVLGIELAPAKWGSFALALDVAAALLEYGFQQLRLTTIIGDTAGGNKRVTKLAR